MKSIVPEQIARALSLLSLLELLLQSNEFDHCRQRGQLEKTLLSQTRDTAIRAIASRRVLPTNYAL